MGGQNCHVEGTQQDVRMSQQDLHEIQQMCESLVSGTEHLYTLMQVAGWLESSFSEKDLSPIGEETEQVNNAC